MIGNLTRLLSTTCHYIFGDVSKQRAIDIFLILTFFVSLFSATCFFFNSKEASFLGYEFHFPVGLLFFPATFVISNIIQDRSGREVANTVVACCFLADVLLVCMSWLIAHVGDRQDYLTVFRDLPLIMGATFVFLGVSSFINSLLFEKLNKVRGRGVLGLFISFFTSITVAELVVSSMSMPMLFIKQGLTGSVLVTIFITVSYKVIFNIVATILYIMFVSFKSMEFSKQTGVDSLQFE